MAVSIRLGRVFEREAKALRKRYHSFAQDLLGLIAELETNPRMGEPLGDGVYKIRLKIASKNKGKSGGALVITLVEALATVSEEGEESVEVVLLSVYDKSEQENISDKRLEELVRLARE